MAGKINKDLENVKFFYINKVKRYFYTLFLYVLFNNVIRLKGNRS